MNPGVWELKREVLCNSSRLMSLQPVLWLTREAKGRVTERWEEHSHYPLDLRPGLLHARWGQEEQRDVSEQGPEHFPAEMILQSQRGAHREFKSSVIPSGPPPPSTSLSVASQAHMAQWGVRVSGSSVFRNGRVGATDTHRYPAAYYFLPALAPLQGPAWQVDEVHEKAPQWASFPGMLLLTGFTNQAISSTQAEWRASWMGQSWASPTLHLQSGSCNCFSW